MNEITNAELWEAGDPHRRTYALYESRTSRRQAARWLLMTISTLALCCLTPGAPVGAQQTLDNAISMQLDIDCNLLNTPLGAAALSFYGPQLNAICSVGGPSGAGGVSAGGGAGTTQSQMFQASVQQRFNALRDQEESVALSEGVMSAGFDTATEMYMLTPGPDGLRWPASMDFGRIGRYQTTFAAKHESKTLGVPSGADNQFRNRNLRHLEVKRPTIDDGYRSGSSNKLMDMQSKDWERLRPQSVMLASADPSLAALAFSQSASGSLRAAGIEAQDATADSAPYELQAPNWVAAQSPKPAQGELSAPAEPAKPIGRKACLWTSVEFEDFDRDVTTFEDGYDSHIRRLMVGADYRFTDRILAGLAMGFSNWEGDFETGGNFDVDSLGVIAYASLFARSGFFVDATLGYTLSDYNRTRIAEWVSSPPKGPVMGQNKGNYDTNEFSATILADYPYAIGRFNIAPHVGFIYNYKKNDSYSEQGNAEVANPALGIVQGGPTGIELAFEEDSRTSVQSVLGMKATNTLRVGSAAIVPELFLNWHHEFQDDQRTIDVSFVQDNRPEPKVFSYDTQAPDRDFFILGLEVSTLFENGLKAFVAVRKLLGHDFYDSTAASIGLRMDF